MGVDIFTFRKKRINIEGEPANVMAWAYKNSSRDRFFLTPAEKGRFKRSDALADEAFCEYELRHGGLAVLVWDKSPKEGDLVLSDVRHSVWADCNPLPGKPVGFLTKTGNRWKLSNRSKPVSGRTMDADGNWNATTWWDEIVDGKLVSRNRRDK